MRAVTLLLTLFINLVSSKFEPYACIDEKAVKLRIWLTYEDTLTYQGTIDNELIGYSNVDREDCAKRCQNFAFMFFISSNHSETFNCICYRNKDFHLAMSANETNISVLQVGWRCLMQSYMRMSVPLKGRGDTVTQQQRKTFFIVISIPH